MTQRGYYALNGGKRLACPSCGEDTPEGMSPRHGGDSLLCLVCQRTAPVEAFREAGALPAVVQ